MSPHDMESFPEFDQAAIKLGWEKGIVEVDHERDNCPSWQETAWFKDNRLLFCVDDLTQAMVEEIILLAYALKGP